MQNLTVIAAAFLGAFLISIHGTAQSDPPEGFTALFNGKDLSGWHGMGHMAPRKLLAMSEEERATLREKSMADVNKHWRVENGELVNDGHGLYLTTDRDYGDIEFLIDYKTVAKADSGIYLRATPQVQIWDYTKEGGKWKIGADKGSGGLWNNSRGAPGKDPLVLADRPFGEWNSFRIIQLGSRTTIYLNGKLVVDNAIMENYFNRKLPLAPRGPIQLQTHGGEIRWRNVFIREIPPEEANRLLQAREDKGFKSIFDGTTTKGWRMPGSPNNPEGVIKKNMVENGAMSFKRGGGNILTKKQYSDFVARLEIKIPPGGNNGLAIRFPTDEERKAIAEARKSKRLPTDTAYIGMCELQVLDNEHPSYQRYNNGKGLDPRQYHGSAYAMAPAHRGYLRPAGQWNFQEVAVVGSKIKVELNGTVILDCDLEKLKDNEFMYNRNRHAYKRRKGHFGFAGHGSPVEFRNIRMKELGGDI